MSDLPVTSAALAAGGLAHARRSSFAQDAFGMATVGDYIALLKPRVMSLVVFTGFVGLVIAPGHIDPVLAGIALLCISVGAGASGALNMWFDADIDAVMTRTRGRPIPQGRVDRPEALAFGSALSVFSVMLMALATNLVAAGLLAFTIGFYVFVYTMWLKRRTPQNIVIGGASGALPPVIGWAAVTGHLALEPLLLFLIIFLWTPPHFWALALYREGDYARAGVPMLPVVAGIPATCAQIVLYTLLLVAAGIAPALLGFAGILYGVTASALGAVFLALSLRVWSVRSIGAALDGRAKTLFRFSLIYLAALFFALLAEQVWKVPLPLMLG